MVRADSADGRLCSNGHESAEVVTMFLTLWVSGQGPVEKRGEQCIIQYESADGLLGPGEWKKWPAAVKYAWPDADGIAEKVTDWLDVAASCDM